MNINKACEIALEYSGERYISSIKRRLNAWIFSFCDEKGHELPESPIVAVDTETGDVYNYFMPDNDDSGEEWEIPHRYLSEKAKTLIYVSERKGYSKRYMYMLDEIYEKFNLYEVSRADTFCILSYYMHIMERMINEIGEDKAYRFMLHDTLSLNSVLDASKTFYHVPDAVKLLEEMLDSLVACSLCKYENKGYDVTIEDDKVSRLIKDAKRVAMSSPYCGDRLRLKVVEMIGGIYAEIAYIRGETDEISDAVRKLQESKAGHKSHKGFGGESMFGIDNPFSNRRF